MPARKSKHSKSGQHRRTRYARRRAPAQRSPLPVVVVVCDDSKTAVAYFGHLRREVRGKVAPQVVPAPRHGATPDEVVQIAMDEARSWDSQGDTADEGDKGWALIDLESEPDRQNRAYEAAKKLTSDAITEAALSNPCFEVWTLAHLVDTGQAFHGCKAVVDELRTQWQRHFGAAWDRKTQADYAKLMELRADASRRAMGRGRKDPSWTQVWKVVEQIDRLATST